MADVCEVLIQFGPSRLKKTPEMSVAKFAHLWQEQLPECMNPGDDDALCRKFADLIKRSLFYYCLDDPFLQKELCDLKGDLSYKAYFDQAVIAESKRKSFSEIGNSGAKLDSASGMSINYFNSGKSGNSKKYGGSANKSGGYNNGQNNTGAVNKNGNGNTGNGNNNGKNNGNNNGYGNNSNGNGYGNYGKSSCGSSGQGTASGKGNNDNYKNGNNYGNGNKNSGSDNYRNNNSGNDSVKDASGRQQQQ